MRERERERERKRERKGREVRASGVNTIASLNAISLAAESVNQTWQLRPRTPRKSFEGGVSIFFDTELERERIK